MQGANLGIEIGLIIREIHCHLDQLVGHTPSNRSAHGERQHEHRNHGRNSREVDSLEKSDEGSEQEREDQGQGQGNEQLTAEIQGCDREYECDQDQGFGSC